MAKLELPEKIVDAISDALKRGNDVELKKVNGQIVVIEIQRKLKVKSPI